MEKYFLLICLVFCLNSNGQENNFYEALGLPKVMINKNLVSYTISSQETINNTNGEYKTNKPSLTNPYNITIRSSENEGKLIINNKKSTEDLVLQFKYIYKSKEDDGLVYRFLTDNNGYDISYFVPNTGNHSILITFYKNSKENITYIYTIADL